MAELFANFTDFLLRKGTYKGTENKKEMLENIISLFSYLIDKDMFLMVHRNILARRLLSEKSEDIDLERLFISNLKVACGMQEVNKLQGMMQDYGIIKEETKEYEAHLEKLQSNSEEIDTLGCTFQCLKTANWPNYKQLVVSLPPQLDAKFNSFKRFYENKHQKRKITICFSLGEGLVAMHQSNKPKPNELKCSTLSMLILLLFNDSDV